MSRQTPNLSITSPTISTGVVRSLITFLRHKGIDGEALLRTIDPTIVLNDSEEMLNSEVYTNLLQAAIRLSNNPQLGLEFGISAEPERWGVLGYIMSCCTTLNDAIDCQLRYQDLVGSIGNVTTSLSGNDIHMTWSTTTPPPPAVAEEAMAGWVTFARWITATNHSPTAVYFQHSPPSNLDLYHAFFQCPIQFRAKHVGLSFHSSLLQTALKQPNPKMKSCLEIHATQQLTDLSKPTDILTQLEQYIENALPKRVPTLAEAATALGLTSRTLQRRLSECHTSYSTYLHHTRHNAAKRYLAQHKHSLIEITFLLGFSEQSAFTRAFKKDEGTTPNDYRKALRSRSSTL